MSTQENNSELIFDKKHFTPLSNKDKFEYLYEHFLNNSTEHNNQCEFCVKLVSIIRIFDTMLDFKL